MPETTTVAEQIVLLGVMFVAMWLLCFWLIAELGGWRNLAAQFANHRPQTGEQFSWVSGKCNFFSSYNNCLTVSVSREGIFVQPMLFFRFRHEPLFIPWQAVAVMRPVRELFRYGTGFEITMPDGVQPVTLFGRPLAECLVKYAPDRLLGPSAGAQ